MAATAAASLADFDRLLHQIAGETQSRPPPRTLEEFYTAQAAPINAEVRPRTEDEVLPLPDMDMTIGQLGELMAKYRRIMEGGYYLSVWTDFKARSLDPVVEPRSSMSDREKRLYDWFAQGGDQAEFNWAECVKDGVTPRPIEPSSTRSCLRSVSVQNRPSHGPKSLLDITEARPLPACPRVREDNQGGQKNINQRIAQGSGYGYMENQTCNEVIFMSDQIVNKYMVEIRRALKLINDTKAMIMERRFAMGKKCGIKTVTKMRQADPVPIIPKK